MRIGEEDLLEQRCQANRAVIVIDEYIAMRVVGVLNFEPGVSAGTPLEESARNARRP